MRGKTIPLTLGRKLVADLVAASDWTTKGVISRQMHLPRLVAARAAQIDRSPWTALIATGFSRVAAQRPELRRSYAPLPRPHLYEVPVSIAVITVARELNGEEILQFARIRAPDLLGPVTTGTELRRLSSMPLTDIPDSRKLLAIMRWPWPIRKILWWIGLNVGRQRANFFGTFGITSLAGMNASINSAVHPLSICLSWSPLSEDSKTVLVCSFDHRVCDGMTIAQALAALEAELEGPVASALR